MEFESFDFSKLNESDIREEIIAPLLRQLGYRSGTSADIIREQSLVLRYPKAYLGRKNSNKDPELRGRADYICKIDDNIQWIIEAKPPQAGISIDDIEQAYTYANHPEIRAVYFCLVNGLKLQVYQTNQGPDARPILEVNYDDFGPKLYVIKNIIGPDSIRRDYPLAEPDFGEPIGKGLRSIAKVSNGIICFAKNSRTLPVFNELIFTIFSGSIERNEDDNIVAYLQARTPFRTINELNSKLGLDKLEMIATEKSLSSDLSKPTLLQESSDGILPAGGVVFDLYNWQAVTLPQNVPFTTETQAKGILTGNKFHGDFCLRYVLNYSQIIDLQGDFEMYLA
jgi:hypothetical protein